MDKPFPTATLPVLCGLIGTNPTRLSQAMHNAAFAERELPYTYLAFNTSDTDAAIDAMRTLGIRGYSATIPHKERALQLVDTVEDRAKEIGAINTIINDGERLHGYNTDCDGIQRALEEAEVNCSGLSTLIIGAGGASRAAIWTLKHLGAEVSITNRTASKALELAAEFDIPAIDFEKIDDAIANYQLIINSTPIGSALVGKGSETPFATSTLNSSHIIFDMVTRNTPLLEQALVKGCTVINGVRMLLFQALRQFELFTNSTEAPIKVVEAALTAELAKQK